MNPFLVYGTALVLGSAHALEADHVSAVTAFAARQPRAGGALRFGFRWAVGHGTSVVVIGAALILLRRQLPDALTGSLEKLVGLALIALGVWTLRSAGRLHAHQHTHTDGTSHVHLHSHAFRAGHEHGHAATMIGLLHGAAGAAPAVALVPIASLNSALAGVAYLMLFAIGTVVGMSLYALVAGFVVGRAAVRSERIARGLTVAAGMGTIVIGTIWLVA
jgi:sulfite exporter TauE/SafE